MAMNKTFSSGSIEPLETDFSKGCTFIRDKVKWIVTEVFVADNTEMRKVVGNDGVQEIVTLFTLNKDFKSGDIKFMANVDEVGIELSKRENEQAKISKEEEDEREEDEGGIKIDLDTDENENKFHKKF